MFVLGQWQSERMTRKSIPTHIWLGLLNFYRLNSHGQLVINHWEITDWTRSNMTYQYNTGIAGSSIHEHGLRYFWITKKGVHLPRITFNYPLFLHKSNLSCVEAKLRKMIQWGSSYFIPDFISYCLKSKQVQTSHAHIC